MQPLRLASNQPPERFYLGGPQIAKFRGHVSSASREPEDWVASTNSLFGESTLGHTVLIDGRTLKTHVEHDPSGWLGPDHVAAFGADTGLLVKLLDAGERLPVHVHPDSGFSGATLALTHGKTEAWVMLESATVYLGFSREVSTQELADWVATQNVETMLATMNTLVIEAGAAVLVPAGLPHAIGEGAFLVELQEPTDLSILLEWRDFSIDGTVDGHLGLGFDTALVAVDRSAWDDRRLQSLLTPPGVHGSVLPTGADPFFRAERLVGDQVLPAAYSVLVVLSGSATLSGENCTMPLTAGDTILTPFSAGPLRLEGDAEVLRCLPPSAVGYPS